jgi:ABC-type dipeptide/oligopeptide/nickel transport system permease subunit
MLTAPHLLIGPSVALFLFVLSANLVGDALQETLNPKLNKRK